MEKYNVQVYVTTFTRHIQEYEEGTSPDAVVVKDLDVIFQAFEYKQGRYVILVDKGLWQITARTRGRSPEGKGGYQSHIKSLDNQ